MIELLPSMNTCTNTVDLKHLIARGNNYNGLPTFYFVSLVSITRCAWEGNELKNIHFSSRSVSFFEFEYHFE